MATSIHELPPSREIVEYYRQRAEEAERFKMNCIQKLDELMVDHKRVHDLEWELRRREEEIKELQRALQQAQQYIFDEREHSLRLQQENDALRLQEMEDRNKIRDLLALTKPVQQELTYFKNSKPEGFTKHILKPSNVANVTRKVITVSRPDSKENAAATSPTNKRSDTDDIMIEDFGSSLDKSKAVKAVPAAPERVLRTVFVPNERTDSLLLTIETLKAQFEESKKSWHEKEQMYIKEREVRLQEEDMRATRDQQTILKLQQEIEEKTNLIRITTKEYFVLSHNFGTVTAQQQAEIQKLKSKTVTMDSQIQETKKEFKKESKLVSRAANEKGEEFVKHYREQLVLRENEVLTLQEKLIEMKEAQEAKIASLESKLKQLQQHYDQLRARRANDLEGFMSDVSILRQQLRKIEKKFYKALTLQTNIVDTIQRDSLKDTHSQLCSEIEKAKKKLSTMQQDLSNINIEERSRSAMSP